jgi:hypothetical protein
VAAMASIPSLKKSTLSNLASCISNPLSSFYTTATLLEAKAFCGRLH